MTTIKSYTNIEQSKKCGDAKLPISTQDKLELVIEEVDGDDYGIDSLYHAQRILEKTLGKVDGYQSDDGILEHKCAISAVKKLYEQKPAWSEEDKQYFNFLEKLLENLQAKSTENEIKKGTNSNSEYYYKVIQWLKSIKDMIQHEPKQEWGEEDEMNLNQAIYVCHQNGYDGVENWLKSLRPQPKTEWSEEDDYNLQCMIAKVTSDIQKVGVGRNQELIDWLKSLKDRYTWKPSDGQMNALDSTLQYSQISHDSYEHLNSLYNDLKKLKG